MKSHNDKTNEDKSAAVANTALQQKNTLQLMDKAAGEQETMQEMANSNPRAAQLRAYQAMANEHRSQAAQLKSNTNGLPVQLKSGIENLSGESMDDVTVHYNSDKPARLQAHAYAQGTDIHVAPGQEKHLPHEAWHVVQQKQNRVVPTTQLKGYGLAAQVVQLWDVKETNDQKKALDQQQDFFEGGSALHHIISRDNLKKLGKALNQAMVADVATAKAFWTTAQTTLKAPAKAQAAGNVISVLENMPLNIEYGPKNPMNDPGTGFDPNTIEKPDGTRALSVVSTSLSVINGYIEANTLEQLSDEESSDKWLAMDNALKVAISKYTAGKELNAPTMEQWIKVTVKGKTRYYRKGLKNYRDEEYGEEKFLQQAIPALSALGLHAPDGEAADADAGILAYAYADPDNVSHFLERHTYTYFTFRDGDIKLINTFWPEVTTADQIKDYANAALMFAKSYVTDLHDNEEDIPEFPELKNTNVPGIPLPVYLMFGIEDKGDNVYEMDLRTLAPEGSVDAYSAEVLKKIKKIKEDAKAAAEEQAGEEHAVDE